MPIEPFTAVLPAVTTPDEYDPARYGDELADDYDELYPGDPFESDAAADLLRDLARQHPQHSVLEFGIGTGRLAVRLRERGLTVAGIDGSERMVARLNDTLAQLSDTGHGRQIDVAVGDYAETKFSGGPFSVVALVFNNIFDPRGPEKQLAIFKNAARHLVPLGCFVTEGYILSEEQRQGEWFVTRRQGTERGREGELQLARYNPDTSRVERTLVHKRPDKPDYFFSVLDTYAAPSDLDKMAEKAEFKPLKRYSGWRREAFSETSTHHVSVYQFVPRA